MSAGYSRSPTAKHNVGNRKTNVMPARNSHIGERHGRVFVIGDAPTRRGRSWSVIRCDCGTVKEIRSSHLGVTVFSCGCLYREMMAARITHHMTDTPAYRRWRDMIRRCKNPKRRGFERYGGRGIKVCDRWLKFENFYADMGECPKGMSIDRWPNKDGNYEPGNCRWATPTEQSRNTSQNRNFTVLGVSGCMTDLAYHFGINFGTVHSRLKRGLDPTAAFTQPVRPMNRRGT